ncbi:methyl-accepting chemotaxis protein [Pelagicoccus sp. SDUM812003]|uniref:methyl-accepting chemotaxis protein n=1 Tax=Pelagicoccus sp. SDUM812003 TaxID=3041267 RepID=UPI00280F47C8|nr:methyl-accepting chemotaxis protein [Pelagicoccus sp. SDUM812003]MDQ8204512.1 methyl-accepting chemotaxis protein [Pelagicoccus sp. SDUM812003]
MNLTIKTKLIGGFLLVAILGLVIGLVGLTGLKRSESTLAQIREQVVERGAFLVKATDLARSAQVNFKIQVQEWKNTLLRGQDKAQFDKYWGRFGERAEQVQENLAELSKLLGTYGVPNDRVEQAKRSLAELNTAYADAISKYAQNDPEAHLKVDRMVKGIDRAPTADIDSIVAMVQDFEAANAEEQEAAYHASVEKLTWFTSAVMLAGVAVAVGLGLFLGGSVSRQISRIAKDLRGGSEVVDTASREVSNYGQSLADSANREAASIQQASASLEVLAENTRENAQAATSATEIANQTRQAVNEGKTQMKEMEQAMNAIRDSSDGISNILKSIDEIAFQTNILALNAAVEAARAGEAGAGFAVVADEVRNLAQRSAKAAQETSTRIEDSINRSRVGVEISSRVSTSLDEILQKASELDDLVASIAQSVERSSEGVGQVNAAIREIESGYQANAAITQESAAAAQELSQQAEALNRSVSELTEMVGGSNDRLDRKTSRYQATPSLGLASKSKASKQTDKFTERYDTVEEDVSLWN